VNRKRLFDIMLSLTAITLFFLPMALIALCIYLDTGLPIFFNIRCHGRTIVDKKTYLSQPSTFKQLKFRTMHHTLTPNQITHLTNDPRVTRTGKLLRATALDELLQLLNILLGHMSFVGPRPITLTELTRRPNCPFTTLTHIPGYMARATLRPGLTGPAQLYLPKLASLDQRFLADAKYARHHTLTGDLKLLCLSLPISLQRKWECPTAKLTTQEIP
jgi:lipopolysaccharide/colanic/teichoic acid biosynthesis glycosyltransferase